MNWLSVKLSLKHWCVLSDDLVKGTLPFCIIYDHSTDNVNRVPVHVLRGPGATGPPRTPVLPTLYFLPLGPPPPRPLPPPPPPSPPSHPHQQPLEEAVKGEEEEEKRRGGVGEGEEG